MVERVSGGGVSLSVGALLREPGGRAPLLGTLKDILKRPWRWASLSIGTPFREPGGGLIYWGP